MTPRSADVLEGLSKRAERADLLAPQAASAEAALRFAAGLYRAQRDLARALSQAKVSADLDEEAGPLLKNAEPLLRYAASGPAQLAEEARSRLADDAQTARTRLLVYWSGDPEARADYLSRALLKPWVELLAGEKRQPVRDRRQGTWPFCGGLPWISSRRTLAESLLPGRKGPLDTDRGVRDLQAVREVDRPFSRRAPDPRGGRPGHARAGSVGRRSGRPAHRARPGRDLTGAPGRKHDDPIRAWYEAPEGSPRISRGPTEAA